MSDHELNDLLEKLHDQIERPQSLDEKQLKYLREIESDIHKLLGRTPTRTPVTQPDVLEKMEDAITTFEMTHPGIAVTFSKLMAVLSNAGI